MNNTIPLVTTFLTVLGGVLTLVLGNVFIKAVLEPAFELKREIGRIAYSLDFHANKRYLQTPEGTLLCTLDETIETKKVFRQHACRLRELANTVLFYKCYMRFLGLPEIESLHKASAELIGHSNCPSQPNGFANDRSPAIRDHLQIR